MAHAGVWQRAAWHAQGCAARGGRTLRCAWRSVGPRQTARACVHQHVLLHLCSPAARLQRPLPSCWACIITVSSRAGTRGRSPTFKPPCRTQRACCCPAPPPTAHLASSRPLARHTSLQLAAAQLTNKCYTPFLWRPRASAASTSTVNRTPQVARCCEWGCGGCGGAGTRQAHWP
jgi:hypothetical protein